MRSKLIILGTDLHNKPTELAAKIVNNLKPYLKNYKILSIQNRKELVKEDNAIIIPKILTPIRKIIQPILLPIYLLFLRILNYKKIATFWTANSKYHSLLFRYLNLIGYGIYFTVISGEKVNLDVLNQCNKIICQSQSMQDKLKKLLINKRVELVYPSINLKEFKPIKKENSIIIPSIPYKVKDFPERGIDLILEILKETKIKSTLIFRSTEAYDYVKKKKLTNSQLINKPLSDKELSSIMKKSKIMPLIYKESPDVPYSIIEGLASGCAIICTDKIGIANSIKDNKVGLIVKPKKEEIVQAIKKIQKSSIYNKNSRKFAEKHFSDNISQYRNILYKP